MAASDPWSCLAAWAAAMSVAGRSPSGGRPRSLRGGIGGPVQQKRGDLGAMSGGRGRVRREPLTDVVPGPGRVVVGAQGLDNLGGRGLLLRPGDPGSDDGRTVQVHGRCLLGTGLPATTV